MEPSQLESRLMALGCPQDKVRVMASQLDKRARQLATETGRSYQEALDHLLRLFSQGTGR